MTVNVANIASAAYAFGGCRMLCVVQSHGLGWLLGTQSYSICADADDCCAQVSIPAQCWHRHSQDASMHSCDQWQTSALASLHMLQDLLEARWVL